VNVIQEINNLVEEKPDILRVGRVKIGKKGSFLKQSDKLSPIAALPTA